MLAMRTSHPKWRLSTGLAILGWSRRILLIHMYLELLND